MTAGLVAAGPWITLLISALIAGFISAPLLLLFVPVAFAGALTAIRRCGLLCSPRSVVRLTVTGAELWAQLGDGREYPVSITSDSRLIAKLALLQVKPRDSTSDSGFSAATVVLLGGKGAFSNTRNQPFRELRVWLRLHRTAPETA